MQANLKQRFQVIVGSILGFLIPRYIKRLFVVTTLYHHMLNDKENVKVSDLPELNVKLKVAKTGSRCMLFPGYFTAKLWKGDGTVLLEAPIEQALRIVMESMPCWIRYGRRDDIREDVKGLREFISSHN